MSDVIKKIVFHGIQLIDFGDECKVSKSDFTWEPIQGECNLGLMEAEYSEQLVDQHPDGFQGWVDFDENEPIWQMKDGRYIPLNIMEDDHLVACYRMINNILQENRTCGFSVSPIFEKWEEVLFDESNKRHLVTKLYY